MLQLYLFVSILNVFYENKIILIISVSFNYAFFADKALMYAFKQIMLITALL